MKIGLVAPPWLPVPPPAYGGTELVVDLLARGFTAAGHDVLLFTTGESTCPVPRASLYREARTAEMGSAVVEMRHLLHAYEALADVDVIHDHTVLGPLYAERFPSPLVATTNHGPFDDDLADVYRAVAARVPIIAISHHQASTARGIPIARVIHHGVDLADFPIGDGRGGYSVFLGRMAPDKGVREAALVARRAGVPLLIAARMRGDAERAYFEHCVRPLLTSDIVYVGEVDHADKLRLLGGARALLNPIHWPEPFGLAMVEALACGTPVISCAEGSAPEIVEHGITGFLCEDDATMADAISSVDQINRLACRREVETRFSMQRMVALHVALFRDMLEQPRVAHSIDLRLEHHALR